MKEFTDTELANEQWRDIEGYDGAYQVSDLGRVRSRKSGEWKVMRPGKNNNGYQQVDLCKDGKVKRFLIHRLVAQVFIPNDDETKTQINHINECKSENRVRNLEWCTARYNLTYKNIHYRRNNPNYKRRKIKDLYRPDLSIQKNIELFKEQGIDCSQPTISKLRRELGIAKWERIK